MRLSVPSYPQTWSADPARLREERALFERLAADPSTRAAVIERFMPLARQLARRYEGGREEIDDLEQVAAIGLMKAVDRFDPTRGLAFASYAFPTVLGELKRHFRDRGWAVRVPRQLQDRVSRVDAVTAELSGELGRSPTVAEIAVRSSATIEQVLEALQAAKARRATSFDQPRDDNDESQDMAIDDPGFDRVEASADLEHLMSVLSDREQLILRLRFGEDRLQSQIAEMTGMSQMHVSRLIRRSIDRLHILAGAP
jgi:RNA polymerase sigma-B factor